MTTVGIRELRQRASTLLRQVERGESIEITDRGRPVALLSPLPDGSPLPRLRVAGDVEPAAGRVDRARDHAGTVHTGAVRHRDGSGRGELHPDMTLSRTLR